MSSMPREHEPRRADRLPCLGRMDCPHCGRPDTGVMTGWRMWPHRYGPYVEYTPDPDSLPTCIGVGPPEPVRSVRYREECPGASTDVVLRAALRISEQADR